MKKIIEHFEDITVIGEDCISYKVPIKEVDSLPDFYNEKRIKLPHLYVQSYEESHSLTICTLYEEQYNQILEQVFTRFNPNYEESELVLESITNNLNNMETHIPVCLGTIHMLEY